MNVMNQRRELSDCYEAEILNKQMLEYALKSPVFVINPSHKQFTDEEQEWVEANVMHNKDSSQGAFPRIVPFPNFRLAFSGMKVFDQWWFNMDQEFGVCMMFDDRRIKGTDGNGIDEEAIMRFGIKRKTEQATSRVWISKKLIDPNDPRLDRDKFAEELNSFLKSVVKSLAFFLFDIMSTTSTVVRVTDDQPGRSVQWRLNREHYLVLNQQHAQTIQRGNRGVTDHDLVRGAHWRRAHLRRLMSDHYTKKRGLLVPVRKAWVGPIEWKGHDGKIYKVIEPSKLNP